METVWLVYVAVKSLCQRLLKPAKAAVTAALPRVEQHSLLGCEPHDALVPAPHGEPAGHTQAAGMFNLLVDLLEPLAKCPLSVLLETE